MNLRRLHYFVAVAEEMSFTKAAARLHIAQPPLSAQIKTLETELGVTLFDRTRREISLAPAGLTLLPLAVAIISDVERAELLAKEADCGSIGHLTIGFIPSAIDGRLPEILRQYRGIRPGVTLELLERDPDELVDRLRERQLDVAFLFERLSSDTTFEQKTVSTETLVIALPREHPLASAEQVDLSAVAHEPMILPRVHKRTPGVSSAIFNLLARASIEPRVSQRDIWMIQTIVALVAAGLGVAIVPSSASSSARRNVVFRALRQDCGEIRMVAAWNQDNPNPALGSFISQW